MAYEYKLTDAIKEGYLCRIMAQTIPLKLDISAVGMSSGDYSVGELGTALDPYLRQIAAEMAARCCRAAKRWYSCPSSRPARNSAIC